MSDQVKFHEFMTAELLSQSGLHKRDKNWIGENGNGYVNEDFNGVAAGVYSHAIKGSDWDADMEAQDYDTFEEFKI